MLILFLLNIMLWLPHIVYYITHKTAQHSLFFSIFPHNIYTSPLYNYSLHSIQFKYTILFCATNSHRMNGIIMWNITFNFVFIMSILIRMNFSFQFFLLYSRTLCDALYAKQNTRTNSMLLIFSIATKTHFLNFW